MASGRDEKVVQLSLENKDFNRDADESVKALDRLKEALKFKTAGDGLDDLQKKIKAIDTSSFENGIKQIGVQFTAMGSIADTVLRNITNRTIDAGAKITKAFTVSPIYSGWQQYAEQTEATQTIMAATTQDFANHEEQLKAVSATMEQLGWFTDETSHRFSDMVGNIGKFTAAGVKLDVATDAMQGIATWASLSGANVQKTSQAMYNLAQAIGTGALKLIDWKSIENANMNTIEFKNAAIDTALALGTLQKQADGTFKTLGGGSKETYTAITLFSDGLKDAWFNSDVLLKTLDKFGGYSTEIMKFVNATGILTTTALDMVDAYRNGTLDMDDAIKETGLSAEELSGWLSKLGSDEYELGRRALRAAQETKTFQEAIDYVKTAVSRGWAKSFEILFGSYEDAKIWWSEIAEYLYTIFVESAETRNEMLGAFKDFGGQGEFIQGLRNILEAVIKFKETISEAFQNIFPHDALSVGDALTTIASKFQNFTKSLVLTEDQATVVRNVLSSLFAILKNAINIAKALSYGLSPIVTALKAIGKAVLNVIANMTILSGIKLSEFFNPDRLNDIYMAVYKFSTIIAKAMVEVTNAVFNAGRKVGKYMSEFLSAYREAGGGIQGFVSAISNSFGEIFGNLNLGENTEKSSSVLMNLLQILVNALGSLSGFIMGVTKQIVNLDGESTTLFTDLGSGVGKLISGLVNFLSSISLGDVKGLGVLGIFTAISIGITSVSKAMTFVTGELAAILTQFREAGGLSQLFGNFTGGLNTFANKTMFLQISVSVGILVNALNTLATMDVASLAVAVATLSGVVVGLYAFVSQLSKIAENPTISGKALAGLVTSLLFISTAFRTMAGSIAVIGSIGWQGALTGVLSLIAMLTSLTLAAKSLETVNWSSLLGVAAGITILSASIGLLIVPIAALGMMDFSNTVIPGLIAVGGILIGLMTSVQQLNAVAAGVDVARLLTIGVFFDSLSLALVGISAAIMGLSSMGDSAGTGIISFVSVISMLVIAVQKLSEIASKINVPQLATIGTTLAALASSVVIVTNAIVSLSSMENAVQGIVSMGLVIAGLEAATAGLFVILDRFKSVKSTDLLLVSAAMLTLSTSMAAMAAAMRLMDGVSWGTIAQGVVVMVAALGGLIGAAALIKTFNLSDALGILTANMIAFSAVLVAAAASIWIIINAITSLVTSIVGLGVTAMAFGEDFPEILRQGIDSVKTIFAGLLQMIVELEPDIAMAIAAIIGAVQSAIWLGKHKITATVISLGMSIILGLQDLADPLLKALIKILDAIKNNVPAILAKLGEIINDIFAGIPVLLYNALIGLIRAVLGMFGPVGVALGNKLKEAGETQAKAYTEGWTEYAYNDGQVVVGESMEACAAVASGAMKESLDGKGEEAAQEYIDEVNVTLSSDKNLNEVEKNAKKVSDTAVKAGDDGLDESREEHKVEEHWKQSGENDGNAYTEGASNTINSEENKNTLAFSMQDLVDGAASKVNWSIPGISVGGGAKRTSDINQYVKDLKSGATGGLSVFSQLMMIDDVNDLPYNIKAERLFYRLRQEGLLTEKQISQLTKEWGNLERAVEESEPTLDSAGDEFSGLGDSIADSIDSGTSKATGAAKSQVSAVEQTYKDALSQIDLDDEINELQYKLWVAENPNATAAEKEAMDLARATDEINFQMERVQLAQEQYVSKSTELGENSKDAQEALKTYLNAQIKLVELQNKATETTAAASEDHAKAFQDAARQYQETLELVDKFGFSQDQLMGYWNSLTKQYGIQDLAHSEEEIKKVQERLLLDSTYTGQLAGSSILTAMDQTVSNGMSGVVETVGSFPQKAADEISTNSQILSNSMYMLKQNAQDAFMNENGESAWANRGREVDNGLAAGISENRDVPVGATGEMSSALVDEAKSVLDIHSPSGVFIEIGSAIIDGLVLSINNGRSRVVTAIVSVVEAAIRASMDAAGIASPSKEMEYVGKMMDAGLSVGLENGGKTVANTVAEMMGNLKKQAISSSDDLGSYLRNTFDLSQDDANINLVVDIDSSKALSDLNQIETAERGIGSMLDQYIDEALSGKEHTIKLSFDTTQLDAKLSEYQKEMSDANKRVEARNNAASEMRKFLLSSGALLEVGGKTYRTEGYYNAVRAFESHSGKSISNSNTPGEYDRANAILQDIRASQEKIRLEELMKELMNAYDTSDITINFTQNNTSPRPLNAVDIYRDTKKQLDDFKTAIDKRTLGQLRR